MLQSSVGQDPASLMRRTEAIVARCTMEFGPFVCHSPIRGAKQSSESMDFTAAAVL